jgi:aminomethyltransferase
MAKQLPLNELPLATGAWFGPFVGYGMPIIHAHHVTKEHILTRTVAGLLHIWCISRQGAQVSTPISLIGAFDTAPLQTGTPYHR